MPDLSDQDSIVRLQPNHPRDAPDNPANASPIPSKQTLRKGNDAHFVPFEVAVRNSWDATASAARETKIVMLSPRSATASSQLPKKGGRE